MILGLGLEGYYRIRAVGGGDARAADTSGRGYTDFDHEAFLDRHAPLERDGTRRMKMFACSVHCPACVWLIEKLPEIMDGVVDARVDLRRKTIVLGWKPEVVRLSEIANRLDGLGYAPTPARDDVRRDAEQRHNRKMLVRLGVAGALAGNVMLISFALYSGVFHGISGVYETMFRWVAMALSVVSLAWPGAVFFRGAIASWRVKTLHMDTPVALGLLAGGVSGVVNTVRGTGEVYFDSVTALVFFLLLGRYLQYRRQQRAIDSIEILGSVTPESARLVALDETRAVPLEALQAGDIVEVRAGEVVPADGEIISGRSSLDYSVLTGESEPVGAGVGESVPAGAVSLSAVVRVRVTGTGEDTRLGRLMALVRDGASDRAPITRLADRIAQRFIAAVLVVSVVTFAVWWWIDPSRAIGHTAALLIVTCPCALSLATPLALAASIGRAAERGILIKGGGALETLAKDGDGGTLLIDKTGTVTRGAVSVVDWVGDRGVMRLVGAAERSCAHPIARALVEHVGGEELRVDSCAYTHGGGLVAVVEGRDVIVGSPEFVRGVVGAIGDDLDGHADDAARRALSPVVVAVDGRAVAVVKMGDPIRVDAGGFISRAKSDGWRVVLLSGDHPLVARSVGGQLGLGETDSIGGVTPEGKAAFVRGCAHRPVVMVGDGVNDAAAMKSADVGIAVHGGAEASMHAADIYLARDGLEPLNELLTGARRTIRTIKVCMGVSGMYNIFCASLAVLGLITPLLAAVLMPISSLTVITIAYRSRSFGDD